MWCLSSLPLCFPAPPPPSPPQQMRFQPLLPHNQTLTAHQRGLFINYINALSLAPDRVAVQIALSNPMCRAYVKIFPVFVPFLPTNRYYLKL